MENLAEKTLTFGNRLKELRKSSNLTQVKLAEKIQMSRSYLGDIETGRYTPSLDALCKIADYFDVTTDYLLCRNINRG